MSACKIFIDRLKTQGTEKIFETLGSEILGPEEEELKFPSPVQVKGEAYVADDHLIVHLEATTFALLPCSVCGQKVRIALGIDAFYHAEPLENIGSALFDYGPLLREALLLELPFKVECKEGNCPERAGILPYMKRDESSENFPFADLDELTE